MAKLHGLTMGLDVCATFHMGIAPSALRRLTARIVERAAPAYLMAVAGNADPMLGYLTTSFREHPRLRSQVGRRMTSAMEQRLTALGVLGHDGEPAPGPTASRVSMRMYAKAGGDRRTSSSLEDEGRRRLHELRERGFDLGDRRAGGSRRATRGDLHARARARCMPPSTTGVIRDAATAPRARADRRRRAATTTLRIRRRASGCATTTRARSGRCIRRGRRRCSWSSRTGSMPTPSTSSCALLPPLRRRWPTPAATSASPTSSCRTGACGPATRSAGWPAPRSSSM